MTAPIRLHRFGRVLVATLQRAPVNALDDGLIDAIDAALDEAEADPDLALLHLRSEQRAFCAGADLALMRESFATPQGPDTMTALVRRMQRLFARLETAGVVTLAEIGGSALGGGLEMALACDLRVAACEARIGLPEARLGLLPGAGGTQRLPRLVGPGLARRLILGAEQVDGAEALRLGLVQWAAPLAELPALAQRIAQRHAAAPKAALAAIKRCMAAAQDAGIDGYAVELAETRALYDQAESRHLVSEFLAGRGR